MIYQTLFWTGFSNLIRKYDYKVDSAKHRRQVEVIPTRYKKNNIKNVYIDNVLISLWI